MYTGVFVFGFLSTFTANTLKERVREVGELRDASAVLDGHDELQELKSDVSSEASWYEIRSPDTRLNLIESGMDSKGDGQMDNWVVQVLSDRAPPEMGHDLAITAIYSDDNGDSIPDRLTVTVGERNYQYSLSLATSTTEDDVVDSGTVVIRNASGQFFVYQDLDIDGTFDLLIVREGDNLVERWVISNYNYYQVTAALNREGPIYEVRSGDSETLTLEWNDEDGWQDAEL